MKITVLGSGSAYGVPMMFNTFGNASSCNPKNNRTRPSVFLETEDKCVLIDAGPELRLQINKNNIKNIDCAFLTHGHYDHIGGIPELPQASKILNHPIDIYASQETFEELKKTYHYLFTPKAEAEPDSNNLVWHKLPNLGDFIAGSQEFTTFQVPHHNLHTSCFRYKKFAYITDWEFIPSDSLKYLHNLELLIIECNDGLIPSSKGHASLQKIIDLAEIITPKQVVLSHLSWRVDYDEFSSHLPSGFVLAYDGMKLEL